jgi:hypothetical protein
MTTYQAFLLGVMVAFTPGLIITVLLIRRLRKGDSQEAGD